MKKKHSLAALALVLVTVAALSFAPEAGAATTVPFMTVDAVNVTRVGIMVTGVVEGDAAPSTRTILFSVNPPDALALSVREACHKALLLALSRPGQYVVQAYMDTCNVALATP